MNPIILTSSFALGRHVPLYVGALDVGTPLCQVRRVSTKSGVVKVQPSIPIESKKTKTKPKLSPTTRTSNPATQTVQTSIVKRSQGTGHKAGSLNPSRHPLPTSVTSHTAFGSSVTPKSIPPAEDQPWLEIKSTSKPTKSGEPDYTIIPGDSQTFELPDGRIMGYARYGSRSPMAKIVYGFHGSPGSRLTYNDYDKWGVRTNHTLIAPERPGYGLSTIQRHYTVIEHARDVKLLAQHLGHCRYKTIGVSGGAPYALALAHLASKQMVTGVLLVVPSTPIEASRAGVVPNRLITRLKMLFAPRMKEEEMSSTTFYRKARELKLLEGKMRSDVNRISRQTKDGRKALQEVESRGEPAGHIWDDKANDSFWGFKLRDVDANKIVILAGGLDENTSAAGAQYMRNHLRNSHLKIIPTADHFSLQSDTADEVRGILKAL